MYTGIINRAKSDNAWITRAIDIVDWFRMRRNAKLEYSKTKDGFKITVGGLELARSLPPLRIRVHIDPERVRHVDAEYICGEGYVDIRCDRERVSVFCMRVLITDGNFKHTLAAVRSLGKRGVNVTVLSDLRLSVSIHSKYCSKGIFAPNPERDTTFSEFVYDLVKREQFDVILPISYAAVDQISQIQERLEPYIRVPLPDRVSIDLAGNKDKTMQLAESIGIAIPKTFYPQSLEDAERIADSLSYPVVVKGARENGNVGYANSSEELISQYKKISAFSPIVQEYITGRGYGFFALYNHGEARAILMHRRLRE